jgi:S1-C subfamily serine protease
MKTAPNLHHLRICLFQWQYSALLTVITLLCFSLGVPVLAAPAVVERGKQATALVVVENLLSPKREMESIGSAFCIDADGFFVTNEHVLDDLPPNPKIALVLNPGEAGQKVLRVFNVHNAVALRVVTFNRHTRSARLM